MCTTPQIQVSIIVMSKSIQIYARKKTNLLNWSFYSCACTAMLDWAKKGWWIRGPRPVAECPER